MNKRLGWFIIAVMAQALILAAVPGRKIYTRQTGTAILLKVAPYDPYSIMSGYYARLNYEISRPPVLEQWQEQHHGRQLKSVWMVLKKGDDGIWHADSIHDSWPKSVPDNCIVIKGKEKGGRIEYGIESYFIPEDARGTVERDLRQHHDQARAEVKVDSFGNAALIRLLIEDRVYEY